MMQKETLFIICLLAIPLVLAAGADRSEYYTVMSTDGDTTDIITAANFAAAMQAGTGAGFSGAMEAEIAKDPESFEGKTLVYIKDRHVRIIEGNHPEVAAAVRSYFEQKGFSIDDQNDNKRDTEGEPETTPEEDDITFEEETLEGTDDEPETPTTVSCDGCKDGEECYPEGSVQKGKLCSDGRFVSLPTEKADAERPGLFTRFWKWLGSLW